MKRLAAEEELASKGKFFYVSRPQSEKTGEPKHYIENLKITGIALVSRNGRRRIQLAGLHRPSLLGE